MVHSKTHILLGRRAPERLSLESTISLGITPKLSKERISLMRRSLDAFVVYPDFFNGKPHDHNKFPPKNEEEGKELQASFGNAGNWAARLPQMTALADQLHAEGFKFVGPIGFCWGGKLTTLGVTTGKTDAAVAIHPAMLDVKDAENLEVPLALFPSKDEPLEEYEKIIKAISTKSFASKNVYKVYSDMHHGWVAARANLDDSIGKKAYEDVYGTSDFLQERYRRVTS
ncbi:hypothetical protein FS749_001817 [Ceratobasidium sp. UAMH 11750]|nr:hypothetical protein FS749_001817 [Ceratobasidium sp. UAMH 11750]